MTAGLLTGRPLSDMQLSMLAHETIGGLPIYTMPLCFEITGAVDAPALEAALHLVVRRHPVLRSTYADGRAAEATDTVPLPALGVGIVRDGADGAIAALARLWETPMDLATRMPVRAGLVSVAPDRHFLGLAVHHVAGDSWSLALFLEELGTAYGALRGGRVPVLPPAPDFFAHAAEEQSRTWDLTWWRERLDGVRPQPPARTVPPTADEQGALHALGLDLDATDTRGVRELARTARVSPTAVLFTAVSLAVGHTTGGETTSGESTVGLPVVLRDTQELQSAMGPLLNTLPVRTTWRPDASSVELVQAHGAAIDAALAHKDVPYSRILKAAGTHRRPGSAPLFLHVVNADTETPRLRLSGVRSTLRPVTPKWAIFPAHWEFSWKAVGNIRGFLQVSADAFTAAQARECAGRFRSNLTRLLAAEMKGFS